MKHLAFLPALFLMAIVLNSCCSTCAKGKRFGIAGCEHDYVEVQKTEWIEEEIWVDSGVKGGPPVKQIVRTPITKTEKKKVTCGDCGSWYCPNGGCCDTVSSSVLRRATAQGATGEPHIGLIPTMKVLAPVPGA